jgi:ribosomal protein S2
MDGTLDSSFVTYTLPGNVESNESINYFNSIISNNIMCAKYKYLQGLKKLKNLNLKKKKDEDISLKE